jgi:MFS family permease
MPLPRLAADLTPLRASRDLRLLIGGNVVAGLGTQATLVALPYQLYVETRSPFLTGLLGAVEIVPLVSMSLFGGAFADRHDRRRLLIADLGALVVVSGLLALFAFAGSPPIVVLYVLGGLLAGSARSRTSCARRSSRTSSRPSSSTRRSRCTSGSTS